MKKFAKILLIAVAALLLVGVLMYICAYALGGRINLDTVDKLVHINYSDLLHGSIKNAETVESNISEEYDNVKSIRFSFESANVTIEPGEVFSVTGTSKSTKMESYVDSTGTWVIEQSIDGISLDIGKNDNVFVITIPATTTLQDMDLTTQCSNITVEDVCTNKANINIECGNINYIDGEIDELDVSCYFGNFCYDGLTARQCDIECGRGKIDVTYAGMKNEYNYDISLGLGVVSYAGEETTLLSNSLKGGNGKNEICVNMLAGDVSIAFEK